MLHKAGKMALRIGYIPEHFSTPIAFATKYGFYEKYGLKDYQLIPYPSGSGHLISSLKNDEVDIVVGLTEAFVRGISNGDKEYKIVGEYVDSPLCWSISTGKQRDDLQNVDDLKKEGNNRIGVSRIGSGSYVMSFVLGLQENFPTPFKFEVLNNFQTLRDSVNKGETDAFMWEYFTTKKYYDNGEIKKIGEIYTPWSSWVITSSLKTSDENVQAFLKGTQDGINYYNDHTAESLDYILENLDYNDRADLQEWASRVKFSEEVQNIHWDKNIISTATILSTAGVIEAIEDVAKERLDAHVSTYRK
jgi:ABC-type nitrate/sulfonate/bicarbonate transport system substrate-binding protein